MTRIKGYSMIATTCCRTLYATPQYGSVNFSAFLYWTDGHKEGSLMPGGGGLRKCKCGEIYLLWEALRMGFDAEPDTPRTQYLEAADLPHAVNSSNKAVELAARREYWMHLNHEYRDLYRAYREAEDKASQAKWEADWHAANPDQRSAFKRGSDWLLRRKPAGPPPMVDKPFSVPPYQPTQLQLENMTRLLELVLEGGNEPYGQDMLEVAEIYRELGQFEEASKALNQCPEDDRGTPNQVMEQMIDKAVTAPVRFRM